VEGVVTGGQEAHPHSRVDLAWLLARACEWDRLQDEGCEPTPFLSRGVIEASHAGGVLPADIRFLAPSDGQGWLALLPFVDGVRVGWRRRSASSVWVSPYGPDSRPLLDGSRPDAAADALLDAMAESGSLWLVPQLSLDSRAGAALRAAIGAGIGRARRSRRSCGRFSPDAPATPLTRRLSGCAGSRISRGVGVAWRPRAP
jgi:hypothetical protein